MAGVWYGRAAFLYTTAPPDYYYLGPAVMVAAGQGFQAPAPAPATPFADFLSHQAQAMPLSAAVGAPVRALDQFDYSARYLLYTVGYWWRLRGVSWEAAAEVAGAFHAGAVVGAYALMRLFVPLPLAVAGAAWLCTSTLQLSLVPHLRDYSKGTFVIATLPLLVALSLRLTRPVHQLGIAAAAGALLGLGLGFKRDVIIMVPLTVVCVWLFRDLRPWTGLRAKAATAAAFLAAFFIVSAPVLVPLVGGGSHTMHVTLLGYATDFDASLGLAPSVHELVPFYNDGYVTMMVRAHEQHFSAADFPSISAEYDSAGERLWLAILRTVPADVVVRVLASTNQILNLVFANPDPSIMTQPLPAASAFQRLYAWLGRFHGYGVLLGVGLVVAAGAGGVRRGILTVLLVFALSGYPSLQFMPRHYLYLQVIPVVAIAVLFYSAWSLRQFWRGLSAGGALVSLAVAGGLAVIPLQAARVYQQSRFGRSLTEWTEGPRTRVQPDVIPDASGGAVLQWPQPPGPTPHYLLEFGPGSANEPAVAALRYQAAAFDGDFSRVLAVVSPTGPARLGFAALSEPAATFTGIELGPRALARLRGVFRVDGGGPGRLPIDLRLPGEWAAQPLYERLLGGRGDDAPGLNVVCAGRAGCHGLLEQVERVASSAMPVTADAISAIHAPIVSVAGDAARIDGFVDTDSAYLLQWQQHVLAGPSAFALTGTLDAGGVTIGLLRNGAWYKPLTLRTPGRFLVLIPVDEAGSYAPLVTAAMLPGHRYGRLTITGSGFLGAR